jgi:hypothetical protein
MPEPIKVNQKIESSQDESSQDESSQDENSQIENSRIESSQIEKSTPIGSTPSLGSSDEVAQTQVPEGLIALNVPVPANLEKAFGYAKADVHPHLLRWVGFWWERAGDEFCYGDGTTLLVGATWAAWLAYIQHPAVAPHLRGWQFGDSEFEAKVIFMLDRQNRQAYAAPAARGHQVLRKQWENVALPKSEEAQARNAASPRPVTQADLDELLALVFRQTPLAERDARMERLKTEHAEHDAMLRELDGFIEGEKFDSFHRRY